jgi:hypothetical protein
MGPQSDTWRYRLFLIIFTALITTVFIINAVDYITIYNQWNNSPEIDQAVSQNLSLAMGILNIVLAVVSTVMFGINVYRVLKGPSKPDEEKKIKSDTTGFLSTAVPAGGLLGKLTRKGKDVPVPEPLFTGTVEPPPRTRPDFAGTGVVDANPTANPFYVPAPAPAAPGVSDPVPAPAPGAPNTAALASGLAGLMGAVARANQRAPGT